MSLMPFLIILAAVFVGLLGLLFYRYVALTSHEDDTIHVHDGEEGYVVVQEALAKKIKARSVAIIHSLSALHTAYLIKQCSLYVCLDTEAVHMARALRIPSLVLYAAHRGICPVETDNFTECISVDDVLSAARKRGKSTKIGTAQQFEDDVSQKVNRLVGAA